MIFSNKNSLFKAIEEGNVEAFKKSLLKVGKQDLFNKSGEPVIVEVIRSGNLDILKILIESGADLNVKNKSGKDLYTLAFEMKNQGVVRLLLENNKEAPGKSFYANLFVRSLVEQNNNDLVNLLIAKRMDMTQVLREDPELAIISVMNDNIELTRSFLKFADLKGVIDQKGNNLLHLAIVKGNEEMIDMLVNSKIDKNWRNLAGETPFEYAVHTGSFSCALTLIPGNIDPEDRYEKITKLYIPCMSHWKRRILSLNLELKGMSSVNYEQLMSLMSGIYHLLDGFSVAYNKVVNEVRDSFRENFEFCEFTPFIIQKPDSFTPEDYDSLTILRETAEGNVIRLLLQLNKMTQPENDSIFLLQDKPQTLASVSKGIIIQGGSGLSIGEAFKVSYANSGHSGVHAEHEFLFTHYDNVKKVELAQPHFEYNGRLYDELSVEFENGERKNYFFEITDFFGRSTLEQIKEHV
ncbi:MAG: ankyrin repeat domain-containing protein [Bacteroidota bacterium]